MTSGKKVRIVYGPPEEGVEAVFGFSPEELEAKKKMPLAEDDEDEDDRRATAVGLAELFKYLPGQFDQYTSE